MFEISHLRTRIWEIIWTRIEPHDKKYVEMMEVSHSSITPDLDPAYVKMWKKIWACIEPTDQKYITLMSQPYMQPPPPKIIAPTMAELGQPRYFYQTPSGPKENPVTPYKVAKLEQLCKIQRKKHDDAKDSHWGAANREITPCRHWRWAMKEQVVIAEMIARRNERERQELILRVHELEMQRGLLSRVLDRWRD